MRTLLLIALVALAACAQEKTATTCDMAATQEIAFTGAESADMLTASALGPSCDKAIVLYAVRTADGHPVYVWTGAAERAFAEGFPTDPEETQAFLERWADVQVLATSNAPAWPLPDTAQTTLDRLTYEDVRARGLPMLCHLSAVARETCLFWEPAAAHASVFVERDVAATP